MDKPISPGQATAVLFVKDIRQSRKFYQQVLGVRVKADFGLNIIYEEGFATWQVQPENIVSTSLGGENLYAGARPRMELCFETEEEVAEIQERLLREGVHFLHTVHQEPWGQWVIRFYDPDGHLIEIGECVPKFVRRFAQTGMTSEQIARKCSMPLEMVKEILE